MTLTEILTARMRRRLCTVKPVRFPSAVCAALLWSGPAQAQLTPFNGTAVTSRGLPGYRVTSPLWSFEAEVAYMSDGYVKEVSEMTFLPNRAVVRSWVDMRPVPQPITKKRRPASFYCYDSRRQDILWTAWTNKGVVFCPSRGSCLRILQQKIAAQGVETIRRRYQIPASFPLTDYAGIRSGQVSGSGTPQRDVVNQVGGMKENEMPSGFGWPLLMFRLMVFTPDATQVFGPATYKKIGQETVAGFACTKYAGPDGKTTYWVEPKTRIVLRYEMRVQPPSFPGSRLPSGKPRIRGYTVRRFRLIKDAPDSLFAPPKGSIIELPDLLYDISLPPSVTRRHPTGLYAQYGLPKLGIHLEFVR